MRILLCSLTCIIPCFLSPQEACPDQDTVLALYEFAAEGHPEGQVLMGFLFEFGMGVTRDTREAALWYAMAAHGGNRLAFLRWGLLTFFGWGVPKNEEVGILLMCLGPYEDLFPDMTEEELATIDEMRTLWDSLHFEYRPLSLAHASALTPIQLASDRPDLMDANDRVYGPGTGDWNTGILRSDCEQMQRDYHDLLRRVEEFRASADTKKAADLRSQISRLQTEFTELRHEAYKEWMLSIGAAMAAGLSIPYPLAALVEAYGAVEGFKSAADRYVKSIDVEREANRLLGIERSLEKARSFGGRE
jgi:hypothetical protein